MNTADLIRLHQWIVHKHLAHIVPRMPLKQTSNPGKPLCKEGVHVGQLLMSQTAANVRKTVLCHVCVSHVAPDHKGAAVGMTVEELSTLAEPPTTKAVRATLGSGNHGVTDGVAGVAE